MSSLTKAEIGKALAERFGVTVAIGEDITEEVFRQITLALTYGQRVELRGFASWEVKQRGAKVGRNPRAGESVPVPPKKAIKFKASPKLIAAIN